MNTTNNQLIKTVQQCNNTRDVKNIIRVDELIEFQFILQTTMKKLFSYYNTIGFRL